MRRLVIDPRLLGPDARGRCALDRFVDDGRSGADRIATAVLRLDRGAVWSRGAFDRWIDRMVTATLVTAAVTVLNTVVYVVVFVPLWAVRRVTRRMVPGAGWVVDGGVTAQTRDACSASLALLRSVASASLPLPHRRRGRVDDGELRGGSCGIGAGPRRWSPIPVVRCSGGDQRVGAGAAHDPRSAIPAMGGVSWASDYFDELNSVRDVLALPPLSQHVVFGEVRQW